MTKPEKKVLVTTSRNKKTHETAADSKATFPVAVRYGWANNPYCNLYNGDDLPASPLRTDDWSGLSINNY